MKKYEPIANSPKELKIEVRYNKGGMNYFTSRNEERGYYLSVTPVERTKGEGYTSESYVGFSGVKFVPEIDDNELGYRFFPEYWGMGLATEAGRASIAFARDVLRLNRLVGLVHPDNLASAQVLRKLGFEVERQIAFSGLPGVGVDLFARALTEREA
jgi:RimJ/RimL family protein N-acetyltransferase